MRKQKPEIVDFYRQEYLSGKTIAQIASENNVALMTIQRYVKDIVRHGFDKRYASLEDKDRICELYQSGMSTVQIGKLYGCSNRPIAAVLEERGIRRTGVGKRKYGLDEQFFDVIDTEEKAYILGLLYADGSNCKSKATVTISLEEEDREILERIRTCVKSEKELEFLDYSNKHDFGYTYKNQYRLILFSAHMCNVLEQHGMVPNKSLVLRFPECIPDDLVRHFVRGYFDGDGTMGIRDLNKYKGSVHVSIVSTRMFCEHLNRLLAEKGIKTRIDNAPCNNGVTVQMFVSRKRDMIRFLDWIYHDSTIYLERKHLIYEAYKKETSVA